MKQKIMDAHGACLVSLCCKRCFQIKFEYAHIFLFTVSTSVPVSIEGVAHLGSNLLIKRANMLNMLREKTFAGIKKALGIGLSDEALALSLRRLVKYKFIALLG